MARVGLDGVHARVLQLVRAKLVDEPDATTFLTQVEEDALAGFVDKPSGLGELLAAVAAE